MKFSALDVWGFIWRCAGAAAVQVDLRLDGHPNPVGWIQLKSNKNHALIQSKSTSQKSKSIQPNPISKQSTYYDVRCECPLGSLQTVKCILTELSFHWMPVPRRSEICSASEGAWSSTCSAVWRKTPSLLLWCATTHGHMGERVQWRWPRNAGMGTKKDN